MFIGIWALVEHFPRCFSFACFVTTAFDFGWSRIFSCGGPYQKVVEWGGFGNIWRSWGCFTGYSSDSGEEVVFAELVSERSWLVYRTEVSKSSFSTIWFRGQACRILRKWVCFHVGLFTALEDSEWLVTRLSSSCSIASSFLICQLKKNLNTPNAPQTWAVIMCYLCNLCDICHKDSIVNSKEV